MRPKFDVNKLVLKVVKEHPGWGVEDISMFTAQSRETIEKALLVLIESGQINEVSRGTKTEVSGR